MLLQAVRAGAGAESEVEGEGVRYAREERYALMEEEVSILKALWTTRGPLNFQVRDATERQKQEMKTLYNKSAANQHVHELAREHGDLLLPQLWTGITRVRPGRRRQSRAMR